MLPNVLNISIAKQNYDGTVFIVVHCSAFLIEKKLEVCLIF